MRSVRNVRPQFDPVCEYVWLRPQRFGGAAVLAGEQVDKSKVDGRRLRQLYDARFVGLAPGSVPAAKPARGRPAAAPAGAKPRVRRVRSRRSEAA